MTRVLIFLAALLSLATLAQTANADCGCKRWNRTKTVCIELHKRIAMTDLSGAVNLQAPTGLHVRISALPANTEICGNYLFNSLPQHCATSDLRLEGTRDPKYCKNDEAPGGCVHIECDVPAPLPKKK